MCYSSGFALTLIAAAILSVPEIILLLKHKTYKNKKILLLGVVILAMLIIAAALYEPTCVTSPNGILVCKRC